MFVERNEVSTERLFLPTPNSGLPSLLAIFAQITRMALLVKIDNKKYEKFVAELLNKLGYAATSLNADDVEDISLGKLMKQNSKKDVLMFNEAQAAYKKMSKRK